jgi:hypothetical protein
MPSSSSLLLPLLLASTLCFLASADLPRNTLGDDTIANEDQPELWGLVKMPGGMAGFEFFVAHFSAPLVCGEQRVVVADPADGCGTLVNAAQVAGAAVLVSRGTCSFESKSAWAAAAGKVPFYSFAHTLRAPGVPGRPVARTNRHHRQPLS